MKNPGWQKMTWPKCHHDIAQRGQQFILASFGGIAAAMPYPSTEGAAAEFIVGVDSSRTFVEPPTTRCASPDNATSGLPAAPSPPPCMLDVSDTSLRA
jgi:hypothetical protein